MHAVVPKPRVYEADPGKDVSVGVTQYYTATTLDGFIADATDWLDWLFTRDQDRAGVLNYAAFIADVGALAMGSTTYEWILEHDRACKDPAEWKWPYEIPGLGLHEPDSWKPCRRRRSSS